MFIQPNVQIKSFILVKDIINQLMDIGGRVKSEEIVFNTNNNGDSIHLIIRSVSYTEQLERDYIPLQMGYCKMEDLESDLDKLLSPYFERV
ncbi:hypothetical protein ACFL1H_03030 [Nanoarchaeota archaeon]